SVAQGHVPGRTGPIASRRGLEHGCQIGPRCSKLPDCTAFGVIGWTSRLHEDVGEAFLSCRHAWLLSRVLAEQSRYRHDGRFVNSASSKLSQEKGYLLSDELQPSLTHKPASGLFEHILKPFDRLFL